MKTNEGFLPMEKLWDQSAGLYRIDYCRGDFGSPKKTLGLFS